MKKSKKRKITRRKKSLPPPPPVEPPRPRIRIRDDQHGFLVALAEAISGLLNVETVPTIGKPRWTRQTATLMVPFNVWRDSAGQFAALSLMAAELHSRGPLVVEHMRVVVPARCGLRIEGLRLEPEQEC